MNSVLLFVLNAAVAFLLTKYVLCGIKLEPYDTIFKILVTIGTLIVPIFNFYNPITDQIIFWCFDLMSVSLSFLIASAIVEIIGDIEDYYIEKKYGPDDDYECEIINFSTIKKKSS